MDLFALPKQRHLRRAELYLVLEPLGFTRANVDAYLAAGTIPAKHIPHTRRVRTPAPSSRPQKIPAAGPKKDREQIKGRAFYVVEAVIAGLQLEPKK